MSVKIVSERLGHSSIAITLQVYGHVLPHMQFEATVIMDARFLGLGAQTLLSANLPESTRIHDLRHAMATFWLAHGVPVKVVSERLGHSNIAITLQVYGHVLPLIQSKAAQVMDATILGAKNKELQENPPPQV